MKAVDQKCQDNVALCIIMITCSWLPGFNSLGSDGISILTKTM